MRRFRNLQHGTRPGHHVLRVVVLALAAFGLLSALRVLGRFPVWRLFFGWPAGGTWSNMIASLEWAVIATVAIWLYRERIGPRLAGWWQKHAGTHEHVSAEIRSLREHMTAEIAASEDRMRRHVSDAMAPPAGKEESIGGTA